MLSSSPLRLLLVGLLGPVAEAVSFDRAFTCSCLNWKKAYESNKVTCGDGLETFTYSRTVGKRMQTFHFCEGASAYNKQDDFYCTKVAQGSLLPEKPQNWTDGAWCYVSSKCQELNGGAQVNAEVSWKACSRGKDPFLADLEPKQLIELAERNGQDIGLLVQMAYPVFRDLTWGEAREVWAKSSAPAKLTEDQTYALSHDVMGKTQPMIFCTSPPPAGNPDACGPGEVWVAHGREVWRMDTMQCSTGHKGCTEYAW